MNELKKGGRGTSACQENTKRHDLITEGEGQKGVGGGSRTILPHNRNVEGLPRIPQPAAETETERTD